MEAGPRRSPPGPFISEGKNMENQTQVRLRARTRDLSKHGCYMDMVNPLPQGTSVKVAIEHGQRTFSATAAVVYSQTHLGMGLEFFNMDPSEQDKLDQWLAV